MQYCLQFLHEGFTCDDRDRYQCQSLENVELLNNVL